MSHKRLEIVPSCCGDKYIYVDSGCLPPRIQKHSTAKVELVHDWERHFNYPDFTKNSTPTGYTCEQPTSMKPVPIGEPYVVGVEHKNY